MVQVAKINKIQSVVNQYLRPLNHMVRPRLGPPPAARDLAPGPAGLFSRSFVFALPAICLPEREAGHVNAAPGRYARDAAGLGDCVVVDHWPSLLHFHNPTAAKIKYTANNTLCA